MLKLRRLRVAKLRNVAKEVDLSFSDGINILLGQNGTGKTTLLELISMVVRSDFSSLAKEEFAIEYELSFPEGDSIIVVVRNERAAMGQLQAAAVGLSGTYVFRPSVEVFANVNRRRLLQYDAEHGLSIGDATPIGPVGIPSPLDRSFLYYFLALGSISEIKPQFTGYLLRALNGYRLDESLDLFKRITGPEELQGDFIIASGSWIPNIFKPPLVPYYIVQRIMDSDEPRKSDYSFTDKELTFLAILRDMMGFGSSALRVDVTEREPAERLKISNAVFRFWWGDDAFITHDHLSYGQKRLVCFFYYLACNPDIVIADELVNGLHHRWITASVEAIDQRQAFMTSQNPILLDYIPIVSVAEIKRSFVLCRGEPRVGRPGWVWENINEEDAQELFSAYGVGVEHVSEILQSRGLW